MAAWMAYASVVGLLFWAGASLLERTFRGRGFATRWLWSVAVAATLSLPVLLLRPDSAASDAARASAGGGFAGVARDSGTFTAGTLPLEWLDPLLAGMWVSGSLAVALLVIRSEVALRRRSSRWGAAVLAGTPVLLSRDTGPAVVGFIRARIVVPGWVRELDDASQRLLLAHEREHVSARDPLLLAIGMTAVALFPWSPGVWLQLRRLRQAIELDCDGRVLRGGGDRRGYGALLLQVADRVGRGSGGLALLSMAEPPLQRRIRILAGAEPRLGVRAGATHVLASAALILVVGFLPAPHVPSLERLLPLPAARLQPPAGPVAPMQHSPDSRPQLLNRHRAPAILERLYPDALRSAGIGGTVVLWGYVGPRGTVETTTVVESSGYMELDAAAERAVLEFSYRPARSAGQPTGSWTEQPVTFLPPLTSIGPAPGTARLALWSTPTPASALPPR
ncbi:MAG: M56 family metallopeptidase [Gemmatimonadota bacterium]